MNDKQKLEFFKEKYFKKFPNSEIEILYSIRNDKGLNYIVFNTKYGKCFKIKEQLFKTGTFSIESALNKTEYFINRAIEVHGDKYLYDDIEWVNAHTKVKIFCKVHNKYFQQSPISHLQGQNCRLCTNTSTGNKASNKKKKEFFERAIKLHGDKYDYSLVEYVNGLRKVKIYCNKCQDYFYQSPTGHLNCSGCKTCAINIRKIEASKNPSGWTLTNWITSSKDSKNFDSFKVYIIKCWNENEEFYKIGRTFKIVKNRFPSTELPYNYQILKTFDFKELNQESSNLCYDLENELKTQHKQFKYLPKIPFKGMNECFTQIKIQNE